MQPHSKPDVVAIIGGGRWARVYLAALTELQLPYRSAVVSAANAAEFAARRDAGGSDFLLLSDVEELLRTCRPTAAIVVNAARKHVETGLALVDAGVPVLIEKPMALRQSEIELLNARAGKRGVQAIPALTILHCSYLHRFASALAETGERPAAIRIEWCDASAELRYGERKAYDAGLSVAQDVMPHIWVVLATMLNRTSSERCDVRSCAISRGGRRSSFTLSFSGVPCEVLLEREAPARRRFLDVSLASGRRMTLDFTIEPGMMTLDERSCSGDPDWGPAARPVRKLLQQFLSSLGAARSETLLEIASETVTLAEASDALLKEQQRTWLAGCPSSIVDEDVIYAAREVLSDVLYSKHRLQPGDTSALQQHVQGLVEQVTSEGHSGDWLSALVACAGLPPRCHRGRSPCP